MPTSNFKLFDENKANMMDDSEYGTNQQRLNGVQTGVASSQLQNKTLYQVSLMSYALGQLMVQNGYDCSDTAAVTTFVNNLGSTLLQKVVDKASEEEAKAGVNNSKYITPATMKAALDVLSTDVDEKISDTKEYVDSKFVIPNIALNGRTFKVINSGKVSFDFVLYFGDTSSRTKQVTGELDCIVSPSGTLIYGTCPDFVYDTLYLAAGSNPWSILGMKPTGGFVATWRYTNQIYFSYFSQALVKNLTDGVIGTISESSTIQGTGTGGSENSFTNTQVMANAQTSVINTSVTGFKVTNIGVMINFPGFLCLN